MICSTKMFFKKTNKSFHAHSFHVIQQKQCASNLIDEVRFSFSLNQCSNRERKTNLLLRSFITNLYWSSARKNSSPMILYKGQLFHEKRKIDACIIQHPIALFLSNPFIWRILLIIITSIESEEKRHSQKASDVHDRSILTIIFEEKEIAHRQTPARNVGKRYHAIARGTNRIESMNRSTVSIANYFSSIFQVFGWRP